MSPEMMIALVSGGSGLALVIGGFLLGSKGGESHGETADAAELKFKLDQALAAREELAKQFEGERSSYEMKITAAKLERDRFSGELEQALKDKAQPSAPQGVGRLAVGAVEVDVPAPARGAAPQSLYARTRLVFPQRPGLHRHGLPRGDRQH